MNTLSYHAIILVLCLSVDLFIYKMIDKGVDFWSLSIIYMVYSLALYFTGFLSGIVIARSTIRENLESLGFVKTNTPSVLDDSITVV